MCGSTDGDHLQVDFPFLLQDLFHKLMLGIGKCGIFPGDPEGFFSGQFKEFCIPHQICYLQVRHAGLPGAEKLSRTPDGKVFLCYLEPVGCIDHCFHPLDRVRVLGVGYQQTLRFMMAAAYAPAKLMQLSKPKPFGVFY